MKPRTRKWVHAGVAALIGAASDLGAQLASGQLVNAPRAVVVGLVVGAVCRVAGAMLAAIPMDEQSNGGTAG